MQRFFLRVVHAAGYSGSAVNYFSPGFREMFRIVERANHRARIFLAARRLAKAETELGLLGWQQADFDEETQAQVDAIHNIEREQSRIHNRSAELARELQELAQKRADAHTTFEQGNSSAETERNSVRQPLAELERRLEVLRSNISEGENKGASLDKEQRDLEQLSSKLLLVQPQPSETRLELLKIRDRLLAIENERKDSKAMHARSLTETQDLKQQIEDIESKSAEIDRQMRTRREAFESTDADFARELNELTREKEKISSQSDSLERGKLDPYREIGRVLAEHMIAPMNQPEALNRVLRLREDIYERRDAIGALHQETKASNQTELRLSLGLWATIILALGLVIAAVF